MNEGWAERRVARPFSTLRVGLAALGLALGAAGCQEKKEVEPPNIPLPTATAPVPPAEPATAAPEPPPAAAPPPTAAAPAPHAPAPARSGAAPQGTGLPFLKGLPPPPVKLPQGLPKLPI
jgi:WAS/WASL-interacting protein